MSRVIPYMPICYWCKHYNNVPRRTSFPKCKAFPEAIPEDIWDSKQDHRKAIGGDNSIYFEQIEDLNQLGEDMAYLLEVMEISGETGLRMAFDMLDEQNKWRWDEERYPKIKSDEEK